MQEKLKITERKQNIVQEAEESIVPLNLNEQEESEKSESNKEKTVITSQPRRSNIDVFSTETADEANMPLFQNVPINTPKNFDVMYNEMQMSKGVADFLTEPIAQVHKSCGKVDQTEDTLVTIEVDENEVIMEQDTQIPDTIPDNDDDTTEEEKVLEVRKFTKLADDPNHEIIYVTQQINMSKMAGPVPLAQQLVGYEYCTLCDKKFKDKRYLKIHMTRLCPFLTVVERVKCRLCGKVYLQDKTYRDHLTKHTKVERYQCPRCGKKIRPSEFSFLT